jgi:DNA helicase-2/ATP-dependent DNA helicase PcrA
MLYGTTSRNMPSRFIREIPANVTEDVSTRTYKKVTTTTATHNTASSQSAHKFGQAGNTATKSTTEYKVGDTVLHKSFGTGTILTLQPMGNDTLMEVSFDKAGTKKMMANFARLEKV